VVATLVSTRVVVAASRKDPMDNHHISSYRSPQ
jgi:hypothetical protein